jgi:hypothetical protein
MVGNDKEKPLETGMVRRPCRWEGELLGFARDWRQEMVASLREIGQKK